MYQVLMVVYLLVAIALIGLVLVQQGKGASMGASFGSGASNTVFGSAGSGNFMTRSTAILATLFFVISLALGAMGKGDVKKVDDWSNLDKATPAQVKEQKKEEVPVFQKKEADVPN